MRATIFALFKWPFLVSLGPLGCIEVIGLIGLHCVAQRAHGAGIGDDHRFANPVHHEPCGLVRNAKRPVDFVSGRAILAAVHHVRRYPPLGQGHLGALEYGSDRHRELAFAIVAVVQAGPGTAAIKLPGFLFMMGRCFGKILFSQSGQT
jgi:hypothetical protein